MNRNLKIIGQSKLVLGSIIIPYTLKRSMRAKLIWLTIKNEAELIVTVPRNYNLDLLDSYLKSKSNWILRTISKVEHKNKIAQTLIRSNMVCYLGKVLDIHKRVNDKKVCKIHIEQDRLIVDIDPCLKKRPSLEVESWLKNQAATTIIKKTQDFSKKMGLRYNKITIRSQKSRWGSCSRRKNLSFNWKLILIPEPVLDYVIIHELSHLVVMNHSKQFWAIVSKYCPGWNKHRKWLATNIHYTNPQIIVE